MASLHFLSSKLLLPLIIVMCGQLSNGQKEGKADARLGLLASSLGVDPVPGASAPLHEGHSSGHGNGPLQIGIPYQNQNSGGTQGGNGVPPPNCRCVPKEQCGNSGPLANPNANIPVIGDHGVRPHGDGLTSGYGEPGGNLGQPATDGSGVIDVRIVNKPASGNCPQGQICCPNEKHQGSDGYPGPGGGTPGGAGGVDNGYVTCGTRHVINIPGFTPEYGQTEFGEYPWMAVILGKENNYVGAGALISPYYVLTAAHKISNLKPGATIKVRLGEWNAQDDTEPYKNIEIDVAAVEIHPQFNSNNLYNDVALIRLKDPVDLKAYPHVKSICLPNGGDSFVGHRCWVAGFGKDAFGNGKHSYIMREVDVPVVDTYDCQRRLRSTRLGPQFELNKNSFLCAGGEEGKDACSGDGGSPLVCENNGRWTVAGLVAWGIGCAEYGVPGVYANVPNYINWIESKIY